MDADRLRKFRESLNISQTDFAESLGLKKNTYNNYETGARQLRTDVLLLIADKYGVTVDHIMGRSTDFSRQLEKSLSPAAQRIGHAYDHADPPVQRTVEVALEPYMDKTAQAKKAPPKTQDAEIAEETSPKFITLRHYTESATAGLGNYLSGHDYEMVDYPKDAVPYGTDYTVKISGDSMEPTMRDGDIAFVKECVEINSGKIGMFIIDGSVFCKELRIDPIERKVYLVSHNPAYPDRQVNTEYEYFRTVGQVLDTMTPE